MRLFNLKHVTPTEPFVDDPFYAWLEANAKKGDQINDMDRICTYLAEQGFIKGTHKISEETLKILNYVLETWYRCTPYGGTMKLSECFIQGDTYYVAGFPHRSGITPALKTWIEESGWIYEVSPDTTYFEIIGDCLYAKYQRILGSRFLCRIEGE